MARRRPAGSGTDSHERLQESAALLKMLALGNPSDRSRPGAARRQGRCAATRGRQGVDGSLSEGSSSAVRPVSATGGRSGNSTTEPVLMLKRSGASISGVDGDPDPGTPRP